MERCLSGLKSTLGKRVCALKCTEGSNPSLSAKIIKNNFLIKRFCIGFERLNLTIYNLMLRNYI